MDSPVTPDTAGTQDDLIRKALENFSRNLLILIKSARVYPEGHPVLARVNGELAAWRLPDGRSLASIGVTPTELILDGRFYGGRHSRASELAQTLFDAKIREISFSFGEDSSHFAKLADLLADPSGPEGERLKTELAAAGVETLHILPMEVEHFHNAFSRTRDHGSVETERRSQEAWLWLLMQGTKPEEIALALTSKELWNAGRGADSAKLGYLLSGLGPRLDQGLSSLGEAERHEVLKRLANLGKNVNSEDLLLMVQACPDATFLQKEGMTALLGDLEGEKLIDVMAGIIASEGVRSEKLGALLQNFARSGRDDALNEVRKRMRDGDFRDFALEMWRNVEELLLNVFEGDYVDENYRTVLDSVSEPSATARYELDIDLAADPGPNLDMVFLALAFSVGGIVMAPWEKLFDRARQKAAGGDLTASVRLIEAVDRVVPYALDTQPHLLRDIVLACAEMGRKADSPFRARVREFAYRHSAALVEPLLAALKEANRISQRRFLVDLLSGLSPSTTPQVVFHARQGPWYLTRNLVLVLGRRRDPAALPYIVSTLGNEERRVRVEVLRALANFGERGTEELRKFISSPESSLKEVAIAKALVKRVKTAC